MLPPKTALLLLCAGSLFAQETRNPRTSPADLAAGRFYHGSSDADLLKNISEGIPGTEMPGLFYNEDRVWQLVAFIRSLSANAAKSSGDANAGAGLFQSQGCVGCHR